MLGSIVRSPREALLLDAFIRAASESDYAAIEVERVVCYAGLKEEDFRAEFADLDHCFLASFDRYLERLRQHMEDAWTEADEWPARVRATVRAGAEFVMQLGTASRTFLIDLSGPAAIEMRMRAVADAAEALRAARGRYPVAAAYPEMMEQTLVGGVLLGLLERLLAEEPRVPGALTDELVELVLTPYLGTRRAREVATEERVRTVAYR